jgi:N-acetylneuraminic acid mutarotase
VSAAVRRIHPRLRLLALATFAIVPLLALAQGIAQPACAPMIAIDSPVPDATVRGGLTLTGWALDGTASGGSGVEEVHVYLDGGPGVGVLLGAAQRGAPRPDVDAAYGRRDSNPGWSLNVPAFNAETGGHLISIYARTRCGWTASDRTINLAPPDGWALLNPPPGRSAHGVAWDAARGQLYALGGRGGGTHADLWLYRPARNAWTPIQPTGGPVPRLSAHSLVWDEAGDQLLIFGGYGADRSDGLWAYHPAENRIERLETNGPAPAGRGYHSAVWTGDAMLLFGGVGGRFDFFDDLWSYDPRANTWTRLRPEGLRPTARFYQSAVWDPIEEQLFIFGGFDLETGLLDEFWSYHPASNRWTELDPSSPSPPSRLSASMVWDPIRQQVLLYGGGCGGCYRDDFWSYQPQSDQWERLEPPGARPIPRGGQGAIWDEAGQRMLLFAGGESLNDLWSFRPGENRWARLTPTVLLLPSLGGARAVWDPVRSQMLVVGGETGAADPGPAGVVRIYRPAANAWEEIMGAGAPQVRTGHTVVWDDESGQALLFGGRREGGGVSAELWSFVPAMNRWTRLAETGAGPVARAFHSAVWDPRGHQMLVYGGANERGTSLEDLWSFRPATGTWTQLAAPGPAPRARIRHSAVWDAVAGEMLIFGGYVDTDGYTSELWGYRPEERRWVARTPEGMAPAGRSRHSAIWDAVGGRMLVFGGYIGGVDYLGDLWAYESGRNAWTQLTPTPMPLPRADHMAVWEPTAREMLVYGGGAGDPSAELWSYRPPVGVQPAPATPGIATTPAPPLTPATPAAVATAIATATPPGASTRLPVATPR